MKIGVLGGSFNPAHEGHIHISNIALKEFKLDEVWWLVSPQNPLKTNFTTKNLKKRINYAKQISNGYKIRVEDHIKLREQFTISFDCGIANNVFL